VITHFVQCLLKNDSANLINAFLGKSKKIAIFLGEKKLKSPYLNKKFHHVANTKEKS
jgi:hypothetical protein